MNKVLHIDSSPNFYNSFSRTYSKKVVEKIISIKKDSIVKYRDLAKDQIPLVTQAWYNGANKEEEFRDFEETEALKVSDMLIDELLYSDYVVIGCPMHNYGITAAFKLYIDQICRINKTFTSNYEGLVTRQKFIVVMTRNGRKYEEGEIYHHMNQQEPYIRTVLGSIGVVEHLQFIKISALSRPNERDEYLKKADEQITNLKI